MTGDRFVMLLLGIAFGLIALVGWLVRQLMAIS